MNASRRCIDIVPQVDPGFAESGQEQLTINTKKNETEKSDYLLGKWTQHLCRS